MCTLFLTVEHPTPRNNTPWGTSTPGHIPGRDHQPGI